MQELWGLTEKFRSVEVVRLTSAPLSLPVNRARQFQRVDVDSDCGAETTGLVTPTRNDPHWLSCWIGCDLNARYSGGSTSQLEIGGVG